MDSRKQFTFYRSFWEAVKGLPKKDRLPILEAIISYGLDGEEPSSLSQSQFAFFLLVRPVLDSGWKKAANGKQGGSKRKADEKQLPMEKEKEKENEIEIEIETEKDNGKRESKDGKAFTSFWEAYPKKLDREDAWEAWKSLSPDAALVSQIMEALEAWKRSKQWAREGGRFIPAASRWLIKRRWECPPGDQEQEIPKGASGRLGEAELEAIRMVLRQEGE